MCRDNADFPICSTLFYVHVDLPMVSERFSINTCLEFVLVCLRLLPGQQFNVSPKLPNVFFGRRLLLILNPHWVKYSVDLG